MQSPAAAPSMTSAPSTPSTHARPGEHALSEPGAPTPPRAHQAAVERALVFSAFVFWWPYLRGLFFESALGSFSDMLFARYVVHALIVAVAVVAALGFSRRPARTLRVLWSHGFAAVSLGVAAFGSVSTVVLDGCTDTPLALQVAVTACTAYTFWWTSAVLAQGSARLRGRVSQCSYESDVLLAFTCGFVVTLVLRNTPVYSAYTLLCPLFASACAAALVFAGQRAHGLRPIAAGDVGDANADAPALRRLSVSDHALVLVLCVVVMLASILLSVYNNWLIWDAEAQGKDARSVLSAATGLVMCGCVRAGARNPKLAAANWVIAFVLVMGGILFAISFNDLGLSAPADTAGLVLTVGRRTLWVLYWTLLVSVCVNEDLCAPSVASILFVVPFAASRFCADSLRVAVARGAVPDTLVAALVMVLALALLVCTYFLARNPDYLASGSAQPAGQGDASGIDLRRQVCLELAGEHGLTERETATLECLSQGFTVQKIAETLCISENTVRTHTKAIYRKLDRHFKQEIIDLVNGRMDGGA